MKNVLKRMLAGFLAVIMLVTLMPAESTQAAVKYYMKTGHDTGKAR